MSTKSCAAVDQGASIWRGAAVEGDSERTRGVVEQVFARMQAEKVHPVDPPGMVARVERSLTRQEG